MIPTTIVVPCYNEARRLQTGAFLDFADAHQDTAFLFVDDGSTDDTGDVLQALCRQRPGQFWVHELAQNSGKAEAVRQGMLAAGARGSEYIGYWDADLATPLEEIARFREVLNRRGSVQVVTGSRLPLAGREVRRTPLRRLLGYCFSRCTAWFLGLALCDTQCGAKLFRWSPVVQGVFAERFLSRWIFDVEILVRLRHEAEDAERAIFEQPVESWHDVPGSKLKAFDFVRAARELASIGWHYRVRADSFKQAQPQGGRTPAELAGPGSAAPQRRIAA